MFKPFTFTCIALIFTLSATLAKAEEYELTLDKAFGDVESTNLTVLLGREAVVQALEAANQQRVALLPNISGTLQQQRTQNVTVTASTVTQGALTNRLDERLNGSANLLNPTVIAIYRAARMGVKVAEFDYKATLQGALVTVGQTYFTHLRNLRRFEVIESNIARARALLDLSKRQFDAGIATQIDVTRAEAQLAIAEQSRLQQETVVYQSELQFKRLLDIEAGKKIKLADFPVRQTGEESFSAGGVQTALERRFDYVRQQKVVDQSKEIKRAAQYERLPALTAFGTYGYVTTTINEGNSRTGWTAGLALNIPIFDGLKAGADIRVAGSQVRSQQYRLHYLEQQIDAEVRLALQDANSRFAQIAVVQKSYNLAVEQLRLARLRFEQGVADNREIIDAQNQLDLAADGIVEAVYQYHLSRLELARTRGDVRDVLRERVG